MPRRATTAALGVVAVLVVPTACGSDVGEPIGASAASDTAVDGPTPGPVAFPQDTAPQTAQSSEAAYLVLTDVRAADHEGFDRIVLEFSGTGTPGWAVDYVDEAVLDGSGEAVTLCGDAVLDLYASGTTWPAPDYYSGPSRLDADSGGVTDVYVAGTFEGYTQVLAGIDGAPAPFRVFALTDPTRLVVDVTDRAADSTESGGAAFSPRTPAPQRHARAG